VQSGKFISISEVLAASIIKVMSAQMMDTGSTSETSVNFYQTTWHYNPEDSHFRYYIECRAGLFYSVCTERFIPSFVAFLLRSEYEDGYFLGYCAL
jgi:hypothetical protein